MSTFVLAINGRQYRTEIKEITPDRATVIVDGTEHTVDLVEINHSEAEPVRVRPKAVAKAPAAASPSTSSPGPNGLQGNVRAPLPGLILEVKVSEGAPVQAGDPLVVLEAMKMENVIQAPHKGTVRKVFVREGDSVGDGDPMLQLSRPEMTTL